MTCGNEIVKPGEPNSDTIKAQEKVSALERQIYQMRRRFNEELNKVQAELKTLKS
jgi:hypothetical protein